MTAVSVAVVVASRNRCGSLARLLDRLAEQTRPADAVVVVDDGSDDGTPAMLASRVGLTVFRYETHGGPARARNRGVALTDADVIAFTDDDCQPEPEWLERIMSRFAEGADVVLGRTTADETAYATRGPWAHFMVSTGADPMYSTCNIAYRRALVTALGGFDESFSGTAGGAQWGEDTDLGLRAVERGANVVFDETCVVQHDVVARGWRSYCVAGLRRQGLPRLVRKHPAFRSHLSAGVFVNEAHAWAPLVVIGVAAGLAVGSASAPAGVVVAGASALPWYRFRTRVWPVYARRRALPYVLPMLWVADVLETAFVVAAAAKNRVVVI